MLHIRTVASVAAPLVLLAMVGTSRDARADAFDEQVRSGQLLVNEQRFPEAVRAFEAAYRLKKQPDLALNIGRLYLLKLRRGDAAQRYCALYLTDESEPPPDRERLARECVVQARRLQMERPRLPEKAAPNAAGGRTNPSPVKTAAQPVGAANPTVKTEDASPNPADAPPVPLTSPVQAGTAAPAITPASESARRRDDSSMPGVTEQPSAQPQARSTPPSSSIPQSSLAAGPSSSVETRPIYKRWWFWTALGLGAAGAATAITLGVVLGSGSSSGPLSDFTADNRLQVTF